MFQVTCFKLFYHFKDTYIFLKNFVQCGFVFFIFVSTTLQTSTFKLHYNTFVRNTVLIFISFLFFLWSARMRLYFTFYFTFRDFTRKCRTNLISFAYLYSQMLKSLPICNHLYYIYKEFFDLCFFVFVRFFILS